MKSALLALAYLGLIYAGCSWHGVRDQCEAEESKRNGGWVVMSEPTYFEQYSEPYAPVFPRPAGSEL
ncbi:MAG TPA: hypothetical protein VHV55_17195 [Pirellulales bacterium]|nr:hypothetical protein [Pirellulales bacterium]